MRRPMIFLKGMTCFNLFSALTTPPIQWGFSAKEFPLGLMWYYRLFGGMFICVALTTTLAVLLSRGTNRARARRRRKALYGIHKCSSHPGRTTVRSVYNNLCLFWVWDMRPGIQSVSVSSHCSMISLDQTWITKVSRFGKNKVRNTAPGAPARVSAYCMQ